MTEFAMTTEEREVFLAGVHVGVISIERMAGPPLTVPVWYDYSPGGDVRVIMGRASLKGRLIAAAGRLSLCAQQEELPYKYVSVEGPAAIRSADVDGDLRPMATRYLGEQMGRSYADDSTSEDSVVVSMTPERWFSVDYGKR
ncbi:MAG: pyridoxamine 5-phosphate oxidase [Ilumatobacter sp.]|nr:pyridoxamine 5-phosphate oxidase [Ilumatobacter sp.]